MEIKQNTTHDANTKYIKVTVPSKHPSNFSRNVCYEATTGSSTINDTNLYILLVTTWIQHNTVLLQNLTAGFKLEINWENIK